MIYPMDASILPLNYFRPDDRDRFHKLGISLPSNSFSYSNLQDIWRARDLREGGRQEINTLKNNNTFF